ncbi:MAG: hypothetical protein ACREL7_08440, partial [Longimicrobiales bacterium]
MPEVEWHAERPIHRRRVYLVLAVLVLVTALAAVALRNVEWAVTELTTAQQALDDIIVTDGPTLDPAYVEAVDDLVDDPRALRDTHFDGLLHTIAMHNRIPAEAATARTHRQMPRTSSLGVSLSLDYDLKVRTRRDRTWWAL